MAYQTLRSTVVRSSPLVATKTGIPFPFCSLSEWDDYLLEIAILAMCCAVTHAATPVSAGSGGHRLTSLGGREGDASVPLPLTPYG